MRTVDHEPPSPRRKSRGQSNVLSLAVAKNSCVGMPPTPAHRKVAILSPQTSQPVPVAYGIARLRVKYWFMVATIPSVRRRVRAFKGWNIMCINCGCSAVAEKNLLLLLHKARFDLIPSLQLAGLSTFWPDSHSLLTFDSSQSLL